MVSHDTDFVAELMPDRAVLMPEGEMKFFDEDLLDLVARLIGVAIARGRGFRDLMQQLPYADSPGAGTMAVPCREPLRSATWL
jgi:hypothetical protein